MQSDSAPADNHTAIDASSPPMLVAEHASEPASSDHSFAVNFYRSCKLASDGSTALVHCDDRSLELYNVSSAMAGEKLEPYRKLRQPASICAAQWYPGASIANPAYHCFIASIRDSPVKLLDASDGRLRASYTIIDHRERFIGPSSLGFNSSATKLYCGFQDAIEVFDINVPGEGERLHMSPSKKSTEGVKGIVSCLDFCPDYSGAYAAGLFSSALVLLSESTGSNIIQRCGGVAGPVTQVKFHPVQPYILYAASRRTDAILSWDLRGDTAEPLMNFPRFARTNQRIYFDIDPWGTTLATGDTQGHISCFKLDSPEPAKPCQRIKAHDDAIGSVTFDPYRPYILSASGARHFDSPQNSEGSESDSSSNQSYPKRSQPRSLDSSIKLWKFGTTTPAAQMVDDTLYNL